VAALRLAVVLQPAVETLRPAAVLMEAVLQLVTLLAKTLAQNFRHRHMQLVTLQ
jgi:hypothetical protein